MIPTLFGVTIVSFCIMQMAPGDPLVQQAGPGGTSSGQTRDAYLVQKRDLKLDKPLVINFRYFRDYSELVRSLAYFMGRSIDQIRERLPALAAAQQTPAGQQAPLAAAHLRLLESLKISDLDDRLRDPAQQPSLARAIQGLVQIRCEDLGLHGVPAAIALLNSADSDLALRIGAIRCLNNMVIDPFLYTYSRTPTPEETPALQATWGAWWERAQKTFPPLDPDRREVLRKKLAEMGSNTPRAELFEQLENFDRDDMPVFAETLLSADSPLSEKFVAALALRLYVGLPLRLDVPVTATPEQVDEVAANWNLHYRAHQDLYNPSFVRKSAAVLADTQYAHLVWRLATFNFGRSALRTREPVSEKIWDAVLVTAPLMLLAQLLIYIVAVPAGVICAVTRGRLPDRVISLVLFLLYSIPAFVAGMLFLLFFAYGDYLKLFPMLGLHSANADKLSWGAYLLDYLWHITLPVTCLSLFSLAGLAMYARSSMLDVIGQDYIRTARAKGLPERTIVLKHALRNSLIPIITLFSSFLPAMLGGSVLVEFLFGIPGMGRLSWISIEQKDFPVLMAIIYIDAIIVMLSILLSDLLYVLVDPRISFGGKGEG